MPYCKPLNVTLLLANKLPSQTAHALNLSTTHKGVEVNNSILIVSGAADIHAAAVEFALTRKGVNAVRWFSADFPTQQTCTFSITPSESQDTELYFHDCSDKKIEITCGSVRAIWFRRCPAPTMPETMHTGDKAVAELMWRSFNPQVASLAANKHTFLVNDYMSSNLANNKVVQLAKACRFKWKVPPTIISNDPMHIRKFISDHGNVVHKTLVPVAWNMSKDTAACTYTNTISLDDIESDISLQLAPGIYQQMIKKQYELRVTCFGNYIVAIEIDSQLSHKAKIDWRLDMESLPMKQVILPNYVATACRLFLRSIGLVFGAIDLIVTPDGDYYFLEINPQGQFLWVEAIVGVPMLDIFSEYLIAGKVEFDWSPDHEVITFREFLQYWDELSRREAADHRVPMASFTFDDVS